MQAATTKTDRSRPDSHFLANRYRLGDSDIRYDSLHCSILAIPIIQLVYTCSAITFPGIRGFGVPTVAHQEATLLQSV